MRQHTMACTCVNGNCLPTDLPCVHIHIYMHFVSLNTVPLNLRTYIHTSTHACMVNACTLPYSTAPRDFGIESPNLPCQGSRAPIDLAQCAIEVVFMRNWRGGDLDTSSASRSVVNTSSPSSHHRANRARDDSAAIEAPSGISPCSNARSILLHIADPNTNYCL